MKLLLTQDGETLINLNRMTAAWMKTVVDKDGQDIYNVCVKIDEGSAPYKYNVAAFLDREEALEALDMIRHTINDPFMDTFLMDEMLITGDGMKHKILHKQFQLED